MIETWDSVEDQVECVLSIFHARLVRWDDEIILIT